MFRNLALGAVITLSLIGGGTGIANATSNTNNPVNGSSGGHSCYADNYKCGSTNSPSGWPVPPYGCTTLPVAPAGYVVAGGNHDHPSASPCPTPPTSAPPSTSSAPPSTSTAPPSTSSAPSTTSSAPSTTPAPVTSTTSGKGGGLASTGLPFNPILVAMLALVVLLGGIPLAISKRRRTH